MLSALSLFTTSVSIMDDVVLLACSFLGSLVFGTKADFCVASVPRFFIIFRVSCQLSSRSDDVMRELLALSASEGVGERRDLPLTLPVISFSAYCEPECFGRRSMALCARALYPEVASSMRILSLASTDSRCTGMALTVTAMWRLR